MGARSQAELPVLLNDFRRQWEEIGSDVLAATSAVGQSGWYILGEQVATFEGELARFVGRQQAVGCGNGMDAIELGLRALGLTAGDRVLTTPLSAFATTLAIVRAGGVPVFADVDEFGLLDLDLARDALKADRRIRFMVPVHLFGHALNQHRLGELKTEYDLRVLEDCCQAIGASSDGVPIGAVGEVSALSFYPTKNLGALGDGGAALTDSLELDARLRALRDYGQTSRYRHEVLGSNSRLDELHAAILSRASLPRLPGWTARRRAVAARYTSGIRSVHVALPGAPPGSDSVWHLFPVLVPAQHRASFRRDLEAQGISTAIHYPELIPHQPALADCESHTFGRLERAAHYAASEVSLPIHPYLTDEEVDRTTWAINSWVPA